MTPMTEANQNLIVTEQPKQQDNQKKLEAGQFFIEQDNQSSNKLDTYTITFLTCRIFVIIFSISILIFTLGIFFALIKYNEVVFITIPVLILLLVLKFSSNKILIIKDQANKKAIIKLINFLCCPKKKIVLDLENTYCYIEENTSTDSDGQTSTTDILYIFNDYKNLVGIDLNSSNIKTKPAKFYYKFSGISPKHGFQESTNELNQFLRGSTDFKNPFHFNIRNYMKKDNGNIIFNLSSRYVKLNDNFFIYHFEDPLGCSCVSIIMIVISVIFNLAYFIIFLSILLPLIEREKKMNYFS